MTKPFPSLALDMSHDGISLHQLAFDGHWHELSRVALNDAALRERLSNMRSVAMNLEGRQFKTRVWLPEEQILQRGVSLSGSTESERHEQALREIATIHGGKPGDYLAALGAEDDEGFTAVAAVRTLTLKEAKHFAKSHGFTARGFSTNARLAGFAEAPVFVMPVEKKRLAGLAIVAASAAAIVIGGGYTFYKADPFSLWELPPTTADFAPFQQPNPGIERAQAPALPAASATAVPVPAIAALTSDPAHQALPYLPPRQLTADAQENILAPTPPAPEAATPALHFTAPVAVNWPQPIAPLARPAPADATPSVGFINLVSSIAALPALTPDSPPTLPAARASYRAASKPLTVANTSFFLEPLPAMATRLSPDALAAFAQRSGLSIAQLSQMAQPLLLIESKVIKATPGLPPILPRLRSGRPIPAQVAPPVVPVTQPVVATPTGPAPLFTVVNGKPDITPPLRPSPPEVLPPAEVLPYRLIEGAPDLRPRFRPVVATPPSPPIEESAAPATPIAITEPDTGMAAAVNAAIEDATPAEAEGGFTLREGQPALLPQLRSGATIPALVFANAAPQNLDPATAAANALRPRRRPRAIIELPAPIDPMISSAAPASAARPNHRNGTSAANVARITEISANRPRVTSPTVPADPQTVNLPTTASVARAATIENAINLRKTNLLGIYGTEDNRTALIRLSGGRLLRVQRGQRFSGWTVVAITTNSVRVQKRNREEILRLPAE